MNLSVYQERPVKVIVGIDPDTTTWYIYRALLTKYSPYFRAALASDRFAESSSNTISLPDDDSHAFGALVYWVYTFARTKNRFVIKDCFNSVKVYCLGDKFGMAPFKNDMLRALARTNKPKLTITPQSVIYAFEHTTSGSGLRTMLTVILATSIQDGTIVLNGNNARSSSDGFADLTWPEFFEGGGEYVSAVLSRFVGGNAVNCWTTKRDSHVEHVEGEKATAGKPWEFDSTLMST